MRYEIDAGRNAAPSCHLGAFIVSIIQIGNDGSSIAMPMFANVMAPEHNIDIVDCQRMGQFENRLPAVTMTYGSASNAFSDGASASCLTTPGWRTINCRTKAGMKIVSVNCKHELRKELTSVSKCQAG